MEFYKSNSENVETIKTDKKPEEIIIENTLNLKPTFHVNLDIWNPFIPMFIHGIGKIPIEYTIKDAIRLTLSLKTNDKTVILYCSEVDTTLTDTVRVQPVLGLKNMFNKQAILKQRRVIVYVFKYEDGSVQFFPVHFKHKTIGHTITPKNGKRLEINVEPDFKPVPIYPMTLDSLTKGE